MVSIQFSSATYMEDESQTAVITVTRTGDLSGTDVVMFTTSDGTAVGGAGCTTGVDYVRVPDAILAFDPGVSERMAFVPLCGDSITEGDETVNLALMGPHLGTPSTAVLTINDTATRYRNSTGIDIPPNGSGNPYPSQITVSGGPVSIGSMRITLYDYSSDAPISDAFLLVGPTGQAFILLANAGGLSPGGPVTLNITDTAGQVVPANGPLTTDDFEPTSYGAVPGFAPPAPPPPYNLPGGVVGGTGTQTLSGNYGGTNSNGVWSLYVRNQAPPPDSPAGLSGSVAGGWGLEFVSSTAANASISGRVLTADGRGIRNARIVISGNSLEHPISVTTGSFGWYTFDGLRTGETYVLTVNSRRFTFSIPSRVISLVDNVADADFIADPSD
jgi:hypothetical protein